jgi:Bacterial RNA polymerase, alpha chain C terminal domain
MNTLINANTKHIKETTIVSLNSTVRTTNLLKSVDIVNLDGLMKITEADLLKIPNMGRKSFHEIMQMLETLGLKLSPGELAKTELCENGESANEEKTIKETKPSLSIRNPVKLQSDTSHALWMIQKNLSDKLGFEVSIDQAVMWLIKNQVK